MAAYARAGSGGDAGPPPTTKSRDRTSAYPATEPTAAYTGSRVKPAMVLRGVLSNPCRSSPLLKLTHRGWHYYSVVEGQARAIKDLGPVRSAGPHVTASWPRQLAPASAFCLSVSNSVAVIAPSSSSFFPLAICSAGSLADATDLT